ncbi:MAG: signal peptidase II [Marinobacterium sp.]|nr:signal peptidase II [Marinobacterium sp.]
MSDSTPTTGQGHCLAWLWLSALMVVLDLGIKYLASSNLTYAVPVEVLSVFDLTLLHNTGAAFSFLADAGGWQRWAFAVIALAVSVMLVIWLHKTPRNQWWLGLGLSLVLGGALGNLYDRLVHGYVVDYLSFHYGGWYFPAFNLADVCITVGAGLLIIDTLFLADDAPVKRKSKDS